MAISCAAALLFAVVGIQCILTAIDRRNGTWVLYQFLLLGPILFGTVLIHELGHALAARCVGGEASGILLWPLGGLAFIAHDKGPRADIWVSIAGPLTHLPMIAIWLVGLIFASHDKYSSYDIVLSRGSVDPTEDFGHAICAAAVWLNILLLVFNLLLPAYPLDGGRIFTDLMLLCGVPPVTTAWITIGVASFIGVGIVVWGAIWGTGSFLLIFVGLWMLWSTYELYKFVSAGALEQHPLFKFDPERIEMQPTSNV